MGSAADDVGEPGPEAPRPAAPRLPRSLPRPRPKPAAARRPTRDQAQRTYRQTIKKIDLWSVLKLAVCFYLCSMIVIVVALVTLWLTLESAGIIGSVEKFFGELLQTKNFTFLDEKILRGAMLVGAVIVVLQIVGTVIGATFYNLFSELFGGVEVTIVEDDSDL